MLKQMFGQAREWGRRIRSTPMSVTGVVYDVAVYVRALRCPAVTTGMLVRDSEKFSQIRPRKPKVEGARIEMGVCVHSFLHVVMMLKTNLNGSQHLCA